ncbi:MAG: response regulator [Treponemataceae bacterium]|nr:response regulator [Treponemataceae bacterium]
MKKIIIVDDEMLVLVGISSMIDWNALDVQIAGTAHNGQQALELIEREKPDIVLIDINMPVKNGLDTARECREKFGQLPVFIFLTSYEEFSFAKAAIEIQAVDYLIKISLTQEQLTAAVQKACRQIDELLERNKPAGIGDSSADGAAPGVSAPSASSISFKERFFFRLIHDSFDTQEQMESATVELKIDLSASRYVVASMEVVFDNREMDEESLGKLYASTVKTAAETVSRFVRCNTVCLDLRHFALIMFFDADSPALLNKELERIFATVHDVVYSYFSVELRCAVGSVEKTPAGISASYQNAKNVAVLMPAEESLAFAADSSSTSATMPSEWESRLSELKKNAENAFERLDPKEAESALSGLYECLEKEVPPGNQQRIEAMDSACTMLYAALSLIPDGPEMLEGIFADKADSYRSIYRLRSTSEILDWLKIFSEGISSLLQEKRTTYKDHILQTVREYININIYKRLSLNDVASVFGFTPNYLSQLFSKSGESSFVEYVTAQKVAEAQRLLAGDPNLKIYELADRLGFESAFYFSTVFKKVTGCSPSEYRETL